MALPSPGSVARARAFAERELEDEELAAWASAPITAEEREELTGLVRWFTRRYPTAVERLAYVRRATARWRAGRDLRGAPGDETA